MEQTSIRRVLLVDLTFMAVFCALVAMSFLVYVIGISVTYLIAPAMYFYTLLKSAAGLVVFGIRLKSIAKNISRSKFLLMIPSLPVLLSCIYRLSYTLFDKNYWTLKIDGYVWDIWIWNMWDLVNYNPLLLLLTIGLPCWTYSLMQNAQNSLKTKWVICFSILTPVSGFAAWWMTVLRYT
jgi:hypothetical protein